MSGRGAGSPERVLGECVVRRIPVAFSLLGALMAAGPRMALAALLAVSLAAAPGLADAQSRQTCPQRGGGGSSGSDIDTARAVIGGIGWLAKKAREAEAKKKAEAERKKKEEEAAAARQAEADAAAARAAAATPPAQTPPAAKPATRTATPVPPPPTTTRSVLEPQPTLSGTIDRSPPPPPPVRTAPKPVVTPPPAAPKPVAARPAPVQPRPPAAPAPTPVVEPAPPVVTPPPVAPVVAEPVPPPSPPAPPIARATWLQLPFALPTEPGLLAGLGLLILLVIGVLTWLVRRFTGWGAPTVGVRVTLDPGTTTVTPLAGGEA